MFILNSSFELQSNLGKQEGLLSNTINSILQDSSGRIWLATRAGVTMIPNPSDLSSFTNITETTNRYLQIKSLEEDNFHNIWFSHSRGIGKINPENNTTNYISIPTLFPSIRSLTMARQGMTTATYYSHQAMDCLRLTRQ